MNELEQWCEIDGHDYITANSRGWGFPVAAGYDISVVCTACGTYKHQIFVPEKEAKFSFWNIFRK